MNLLLKDQQTSIFKKSVQTSSLVGHENMEHHKINEEGIMDQEGVKGQWQFLASLQNEGYDAYLYLIQGVIFSMPMKKTMS